VELIRLVPSIRVLSVVGGSDSFSAAAASLGITQSAVSQHIATLERQVGQPLVHRSTRPVELTQAGSVLAEHGKAVLVRLDAAGLDLDEISARRHQRLRMGGFPTALATVVPRALALLHRQQPQVSLVVVDDHVQGLLPRLLRRELDVAVVFDDAVAPSLPNLADELSLTPLFGDPYRLLVPRSHRWAREERDPPYVDLPEQTWTGGGPASTWFQIVRRACAAAGFEPHVGLTSDDYLAVQAFVAAGLGVAMVPGLVASRRIAGVQVRSLRGPTPQRNIVAACPTGQFRPAAAVTMVALLEHVTETRR
jgi:DNA-binding transcriptional LysR family regulator